MRLALRLIILALIAIVFAEGLVGVLATGDTQSWVLALAAPLLFVGKLRQEALRRWMAGLGPTGARRLNLAFLLLTVFIPLVIALPFFIGKWRGH